MLWSSLPLTLFSSKTMIAGADVVHYFIFVSAAFVADVIAVVVVTAVAVAIVVVAVVFVVVVDVVVFACDMRVKKSCAKNPAMRNFCPAKSDPRDLGVPKLFNQMQRISFNDYA